MNIYIGNLSTSVTEEDLKNLFSEFGKITSARVIKDNYLGTSKGFGFVEITGEAEGQEAIKQLNSKDFKGKKIVVNEARPKKDNPTSGAGRNFKSPYGGRSGKW